MENGFVFTRLRLLLLGGCCATVRILLRSPTDDAASMVSFCCEKFLLCFVAKVLIFLIVGLLYLLCLEHVDNLGAYSIPSETGLLISSVTDSLVEGSVRFPQVIEEHPTQQTPPQRSENSEPKKWMTKPPCETHNKYSSREFAEGYRHPLKIFDFSQYAPYSVQKRQRKNPVGVQQDAHETSHCSEMLRDN